MKCKIPNVYQEPLGGPLYWMHEETGELKRIVEKYIRWHISTSEDDNLSEDETALLRDYFRHWINAPCWKIEGVTDKMVFSQLKKDIETIETILDFDQWLKEALELGIDPL